MTCTKAVTSDGLLSMQVRSDEAATGSTVEREDGLQHNGLNKWAYGNSKGFLAVPLAQSK
jgi:hypothetical protein